MQIKNTEKVAKDLLSMKLATILFGLLALMIITPRHCMANNLLLSPNSFGEGRNGLQYGNYTFALSNVFCQLGLYDIGQQNTLVWMSNEPPEPPLRKYCYAKMQSDGNLVLYNRFNNVVWSSGSNQEGPTNCYVLILQPDRNVVIYGGGGAIWATGTNVRTSTSILGQNSTATIVTGTASGGDAVMVN